MVGPSPVLVAAVGLGLLHGIEPGHGWPLAAAYALPRAHRWASGALAALLLGLGHLLSSLVLVGLYLLAGTALDLGSLRWLKILAGLLLVGLGTWNLTFGRGHHHGGGHHHHGMAHGHADDAPRAISVDGTPVELEHDHDHGASTDAAGATLRGIVVSAVVLGFVHEEEFQILGLCLGSTHCLSLMLAYATAVIVSLVALTLMLLMGFHVAEDRFEGIAPYLPIVAAAVLIASGAGFLLGIL